MKLSRLIILLIIFLANAMSIPCIAQTDSVTCIENYKEDFLIKGYVRGRRLIADSANCAQQNNILVEVVKQVSEDVDGCNNNLEIRTNELTECKKYYQVSQDCLQAQAKKTGNYKTATVTLGSVVVALVIAFALILK